MNKSQKLKFVGLLAFIVITLADFGTDIFQAYVYKRSGDHFYFGWTLAFILMPGWITSIDINIEVDFLKRKKLIYCKLRPSRNHLTFLCHKHELRSSSHLQKKLIF